VLKKTGALSAHFGCQPIHALVGRILHAEQVGSRHGVATFEQDLFWSVVEVLQAGGTAADDFEAISIVAQKMLGRAPTYSALQGSARDRDDRFGHASFLASPEQ